MKYSTTATVPTVTKNAIVKNRITLEQLQNVKCRQMIDSLSEAELEKAARSSYRYFVESNSAESQGERPNEEDRLKYATRMARRHLLAEKGNTSTALKKMKATIVYRDEIHIDVIRQCFTGQECKDEKEMKLREKLEAGIERELSDGKHFIRGHDKKERSLFCIFPRRYQSFDSDWYLLGKIYCIERALAYTERMTEGRQGKVNVLFDYNHSATCKEPPVALVKDLMFCLRDHYPERLNFMCFVDAPFKFRAFWTLVKPFIDPVTKKKIRFINGDQQKSKFFSAVISESQQMSFMRTEKGRTEEYDIQRYLHETPFEYDMDEN